MLKFKVGEEGHKPANELNHSNGVGVLPQGHSVANVGVQEGKHSCV